MVTWFVMFQSACLSVFDLVRPAGFLTMWPQLLQLLRWTRRFISGGTTCCSTEHRVSGGYPCIWTPLKNPVKHVSDLFLFLAPYPWPFCPPTLPIFTPCSSVTPPPLHLPLLSLAVLNIHPSAAMQWKHRGSTRRHLCSFTPLCAQSVRSVTRQI